MKISKAIISLVIIGLLTLTVTACPAPAPVAPVEPIPIAALQDTTGVTSDVGKDEALGVREAVAYYNDHGGIGGRPIKLLQYDYGYRIPEAITLYTRWRDIDRVVFVKGWGTPDTEALTPTITKDKLPFVSASWSAHLCDPAKTPFNFIYGVTDYTTQARGLVQYWYDTYWLKDPVYKADREAGVKPRIVAFGHVGHPYPTAPLAGLRDQIKLLGGVSMTDDPKVHDQHISLTALDAKSQVLAVKAWGPPHFIWFGNTCMTMATVVRELAAAGLLYPKGPTMIGANNYGFDETYIRMAGPVAEGTLGSPGTRFFMEEYPWRDRVHEYAKKINPGVPFEMRSQKTLGGWAAVTIIVEALRRAHADGKLDLARLAETRIAIRDALYKAPVDLTGLGHPAKWTVTPKDHRPSSWVLIGKVVKGKPVTVGKIDMKAKYPDLWPKWLGW